MIRFSEIAGLLAGVTLFLGTLLVAQAYIAHEAPELRVDLVELQE